MKFLAILLVMTGCSEILTPFEVLVPVSVPCVVEIPQAPVWPTSLLPIDAGMFDRTKAVLAESESRKAYEERLLAALMVCQ